MCSSIYTSLKRTCTIPNTYAVKFHFQFCVHKNLYSSIKTGNATVYRYTFIYHTNCGHQLQSVCSTSCTIWGFIWTLQLCAVMDLKGWLRLPMKCSLLFMYFNSLHSHFKVMGVTRFPSFWKYSKSNKFKKCENQYTHLCFYLWLPSLKKVKCDCLVLLSISNWKWEHINL
jgi:hypothetical protein